jgi:hypothetical protein
MSIKIIEGKRETITEYSLNFYLDPTGGFSFPCDEKGNITEALAPEGIENLKFCREHPEKFYRPGYVEKRQYTIKNRNIGICNCGVKFEMYEQYLGSCQCPRCGQWYNLWGQELLPPDRWE